MKRTLLILLGVLVLLVLGAALALPFLVDVERHRPAIQKALETATGRQVDLGFLSLSIFPRPTLDASGLSVGEDPGFGEKPFLQAEGLQVRVALLPLLRGKVAVDSMTITGPSLRLIRKRDRGWNVASLLTAGQQAEAPAQGRKAGGKSGPAAPGKGGAGAQRAGGVSLLVKRLGLRGGRLVIRDEGLEPGRKVEVEARDIALTLTDLSPSTPTGFDVGLTVEDAGEIRLQGTVGPPPSGAGDGWPLTARLRLKGFSGGPALPYLESFTGLKLRGGTADADLRLSGAAPGSLAVEGEVDLQDVKMGPLAGGGKPVKLSGRVSLKGALAGDAVRLERCDIRTGGSTVSVTGSVTGLRARPAIEARVKSDRVGFADLRPILALMGPAVPAGLAGEGTLALDARVRGPLANPGALAVEGKASIEGFEYGDPALKEPIREIRGKVALNGNRVSISGFGAALGKSRLEGSCTLIGFDRPVLDVQLASPNLDLDEILSFLTTTESEEQAEASATEPARGPAHSGRERPGAILLVRNEGSPVPFLPEGSILRDLALRGSLSVQKMKLLNLRLSAVGAGLSMSGGIAVLEDLRLQLYGGSMQGRASARLAEPGPPFGLSGSLEGVDFNAMAGDYSKEMAGLVHGTLKASLDLKGRGLARRAIKRRLAGNGEIEIRDGRLTSFGVIKRVASALEEAGGGGVGKEETPFEVLGGAFTIGKGRARTDDLRLLSDDIKLRGKGHVDLDLDLDLEVSARFSPGVSAAMIAQTPDLKYFLNDKDRLAADFDVGGSLMDPSIRLQKETIREAAKEAAKDGRFGLFKRILEKRQERKREKP